MFYENETTRTGRVLVPVIVHCSTCETWDVPGHILDGVFTAHRKPVKVAENQTGYWIDEIGIYHWYVKKYNHCCCERNQDK
jgi:hypothetical protein